MSNGHSVMNSVSGKGENQEHPGLPLVDCWAIYKLHKLYARGLAPRWVKAKLASKSCWRKEFLIRLIQFLQYSNLMFQVHLRLHPNLATVQTTITASLDALTSFLCCHVCSLRAGSLFGGQRNVNYFLTWIIFFESAEGASFGERSEPLGERSEPAVKIESLHVSHWILNPARSSTNAALWLVKNDRLN